MSVQSRDLSLGNFNNRLIANRIWTERTFGRAVIILIEEADNVCTTIEKKKKKKNLFSTYIVRTYVRTYVHTYTYIHTYIHI